MTQPLLVVHNDEPIRPGRLLDALHAEEVEYQIVRPFAGDPIPDFTDYGGVVILGGTMGVYDAHRFPYLRDEMSAVLAAVAEDVPVLGICLGGQLLAAALGGEAHRSERAEARFEAFSSPAAEEDALLRHLDGPQLATHQDTWTAPPGAVTLLESPDFPLAFRFGSALAIQTHPEITPEILDLWMEGQGFHDLLAEAGTNAAAISLAVATAEAESRDMAERFFRAWIRSTAEESVLDAADGS